MPAEKQEQGWASVEEAALWKKGDAIVVDDLPHRLGFPWFSAAEAKTTISVGSEPAGVRAPRC